MQLRSVMPRIRALDSYSLLQDGYTVDRRNPGLGEITLADVAHVGADQAGRVWQAVAATARRGAERRRQWIARLIGRVRTDCGPVAGLQPTATQAAASREVSRRRSEAMRGLFPKLAAWYEHRSYMVEMRDVDRYLSQSSDLADLERRIRDVERRAAGSGWF